MQYFLENHTGTGQHQSLQQRVARYQRSRKLCSITSRSAFCIGMVLFRLSNPHDDVMSLCSRDHPQRRKCSPSLRRTLLPTSSRSTKSTDPASPFDVVWTTRSVTGIKNSRGIVLTTSRRHERIVLSREFLVGIVAVEPTRTSIIFTRTHARNSRLFNLGKMSCFNQHNAVKWIWIPFRLQP